MTYRCWLVLLACFGLSWARVLAQDLGHTAQNFAVVAFHDVVDPASELDHDSVTTDRLIAFFDHLRGDGWSPVSLQDIRDARLGTKPLPTKPILITFDDGYRSLYTRVFPLLMAYRIPVVAALVGEWMSYPPGSIVPYGGRGKPREHFIDWAQAREMQASGLVEFASHSFNQHRELRSNPQGNLTPALVSLEFDPATARYETPAQYQQRIQDDIRANELVMHRELGQKPRAMVWPYGRYNQIAVDVLRQAGYEFALTLMHEPGHLQQPLAIGRYWPSGNSRVVDWVNDLSFAAELPSARRMVRIDPGHWWTGDMDAFDQRLGETIELLLTQAISDVVIDGLHRDHVSGRWTAWFPSGTLPLRADLLSRMVWQLQTRANVRTSVDLSFQNLLSDLSEIELKKLHQDLGRQVPTQGLWMRLTPLPGQDAIHTKDLSTRWASIQGLPRSSAIGGDLRSARNLMDEKGLDRHERLAIEAFRAVQDFRPGLQWTIQTAFDNPMPLAKWADLVMVNVHSSSVGSPGVTRDLLAVAGVNGPGTRRRTGMWVETGQPPSEAQSTRIKQQLLAEGLAVLGGPLLID